MMELYSLGYSAFGTGVFQPSRLVSSSDDSVQTHEPREITSGLSHTTLSKNALSFFLSTCSPSFKIAL